MARDRPARSDGGSRGLAIRAAEEAREVDGHDEMHDVISGEFDYNTARQELGAGTVYVVLGDGSSAERHSQRALDLHAALPAVQQAYFTENAAGWIWPAPGSCAAT